MKLLVPCLMTLHLLSMPTTGQTPNKILSNGTIQWGQLAPDRPYKTVDFKVDVGGMGSWYSFSRSIVSSALAEHLPTPLFEDFANGTIEGKNLVATVMITSPGYVVCLVFGFLFTIIFFCCCICCFCCYCCSFCSTCCSSAKEVKSKGTPSNSSRIVMGVSFFVLTIIAFSCAALVFESSRQINESVKGLNQAISDGFNDVDTFFENIKSQFTRIGDENFNFLSRVLQGYVSGVAGNVSKRLTEQLSDSAGLSTPLNKLSNYSEEAAKLTSELNQAAKDLRTSRESAVKDLTTRCAATCGSQISGLRSLALTELITKTEDVKQKFATNVFTAIKNTIDNRIKTEADKATKDVDPLSKMNRIFKEMVTPILDLISSFQKQVNNESSKIQNQSDNLIKEGDKFNDARFALTLTPALVVVGTTVLAFLGLFFGLLCSYLQGNSTNVFVSIGSISLISATIIIFVITSPMMLVSTMLFMFGSPLERYGCQTLMDYKKLEKYAAAAKSYIDLSNYTVEVVDRNVSLNFFDVMEKCGKGETLYTAAKMQDVVDVALEEIWNYKEDLKINDKMNFSNTANAALGNLNVQKEIDALKGTVTSTDNLLSSISPLKTSLGGQSNADLLKPMQDKLTVMESITKNLKQLAVKFDVEAGALPPLITQASTKLGDKAFVVSVMEKASKEVVDAILGFIDSYRNDVITKLEKDVGKCIPAVSITHAVLNEALCRGVVDPLNGLWLSLGSCAFLLVPILLCIRYLPGYFVEKKTIDQTQWETPGYYPRNSGATTAPYVPYSRVTPGVPSSGIQSPDSFMPSIGATPGAYGSLPGRASPGAYGSLPGATPGAYGSFTGETGRSKASLYSTNQEEEFDSDMKRRDTQRTDPDTSSAKAGVGIYPNISPFESSADPVTFDKSYRESDAKSSISTTRTSSEVATNPSVSFNKANSSGSLPQ